MRIRYSVFVCLLLLVLAPALALAQEATCEPLVKQAITDLGNNCRDSQRNSACYGNAQVNATFAQAVAPDFFTRPGDKTGLELVRTIQTSQDLSQGRWGIAVLNLQADIPETLPGQVVRVLLLGDAQVEAAPQTGAAVSPMQAFFLRTNFSGVTCKQAPSVIGVQSPEGIKVSLNVNGANISMGSSGIIRILPPGNTIQVINIEGQFTLEPNSPNPIVLPAATSSLRCLSEAKSLGVDGAPNDQLVSTSCPWTAPIPGTQDEYQLALIVMSAFDALSGQACANGGQDIVHTVQSGQNLFRIAQSYGTSINAIVQENNLANANAIFVGQKLNIKCALNTGRSPFAPRRPIPPFPATGPNVPPFPPPNFGAPPIQPPGFGGTPFSPNQRVVTPPVIPTFPPPPTTVP
jgi:hypothetical protein